MTRKKWSLEEWRAFVMSNFRDSYSLVVCVAILILMEQRVGSEQRASRILKRSNLPLTESQTHFAINFTMSNVIEEIEPTSIIEEYSNE